MKLRIRSVNGGETLRIDIPADSNLQSLKSAVAQKLNPSDDSEIHLSLNKKEELNPPQEPLQSFGIRGGDLVFYTLEGNSFEKNISLENPKIQAPVQSPNVQAAGTNPNKESMNENPRSQTLREKSSNQTLGGNPNNQSLRELCASAALKRAAEASVGYGSSPRQSTEAHVEMAREERSAAEERTAEREDIEVDVGDMEVDGEDVEFLEKSRSAPFFLERVLSEERENVKGDHGLLTIAVHAVILESGFLRFDPRANKGFPGFGLPQGWALKWPVSLRYTVPELVDVNGDGERVENVEFKFQVMGNFLVVYGSLANAKGSQHYRLSLEVRKYLPSLEHVNRDNLSSKKESSSHHGSGESSCNREYQIVGETLNKIGGKSNLPTIVNPQDSSVQARVLFELWRVVKDTLCMPVLTALCEKTGLPLPPSLIMLPTELKMKILEALPAVDVAKVGCLCREFLFLSANDELWKQKYVDEFRFLPPNGSRPPGAQTWKDAFQRMLVQRKKINQRRRRMPFMQPPRPFRRFPPPSPFGGPGFNVWGGDYDRFPAIGGGNLLGGGPLGGGSLLGGGGCTLGGGGIGGRGPGFPLRRFVTPGCDLIDLDYEFRGDLDNLSFPDL